MKRLLILLLSVGLFNLSSAQTFTGQAYLLAEKLVDKCTVESRCDCCAADLFFVSNKEFVVIDYCVPDAFYYKGTYKTRKSRLILKFNRYRLSETFDQAKNQSVFKKEKGKGRTESLQFGINSCEQGKVILDGKKNKGSKYGTRRPANEEKEKITEFMKSKQWKLLND